MITKSSFQMRYLDLFSGIGGFTLGIQQAYENIEEDNELSQPLNRESVGTVGHKRNSPNSQPSLRSRGRTHPVCIGYSELDKYAIQIYEKQFTKRLYYCGNCWEQDKTKGQLPTEGESVECESGKSCINCGEPASLLFIRQHKNYGDITKINEAELPDFDMLVGGVPCQSWSIAGKRGGFGDERGNMWFQYSKILRAKQPKYFIAENVKGLLSHDGGKSMERICEELCDCGYAIDFEVLNSKNFGVPQSRERVFIIGVRIDLIDKCQLF